MAIDGNVNNYWESNSESSPWIAVDMTKILRVYQVDITFDTVNAPTSFYIQSTDNPNDSSYGQNDGAWDTLQTDYNPKSGKNSYLIPSRSQQEFRYLRIKMVGTGVMRIKEIAIWAATTTQGTTTRFKIGPNYITTASHDIMMVTLTEGPISDKCNEVNFKLNNKNEKYLQSNYPLGSPFTLWIDGVLKLFGTLSLFTPHYDTSGFIIDGQAKDYGDFMLNQTVRQAWASLTPSDPTQANDIISTGPSSILGLVTTSTGSRLFPGQPTGYPNIQSTAASPNFIPYFKSKNRDAWSLFKDLKVQAVDGAWGVQNGLFNQPQTLQTSVTVNNTISDGYWFAYNTTITSVGSSDSLTGNVASVGTAFAKTVVDQYDIVTQLNNDQESIYGTYFNADQPAQYKRQYPYYDGGIAAEGQYVYSELYQPVLFLVSQISNSSSSITVSEQLTPSSSDYNPQNASALTPDYFEWEGVADIIIEGIALSGQVRRLHYVWANIGVTDDNDPDDMQRSFFSSLEVPNTQFTGFPDKMTPTGQDSQDGYILPSTDDFSTFFTGVTWNRNLYLDWISKFGSSSTTDTITALRARVFPFIDKEQNYSYTPNVIATQPQFTTGLKITQFNITLNSSVKNPPRQFDFFASSTTSSGTTVPDFQWFSQPRLGIDTNRNLDDTNTIRIYTDFPRSDLNTLISFDIMPDPYTVKNESFAVGSPSYVLPQNFQVNARDPNYLIGLPPWHGTNTPKFDVSSVTSMATLGRRKVGTDITGTIQDTARTAIGTLNSSLTTPNRVTIKTRGNANLTPGQVVYLDSSYVAPKGYWYIVSTTHSWTVNGYETEITASTDKLRFSTELVRLQQQVYASAFVGNSPSIANQTGTTKTATFSKYAADMNGVEITQNPEQSPSGQPSVRFPYNFLPEFAHVKRIQVSTTRLLAPLQHGFTGQGTTGIGILGNKNTYFGWDTGNTFGDGSFESPAQYFDCNDGNQFAQRFVSTTSANSFRLDFAAYLSNLNYGSGSTLVVTVYTDQQKAGAGPIPANANWGLFVGPGLYALGGLILGAFGVTNSKLERPTMTGSTSVIIPFGNLSQTSVGAGGSLQTSVELNLQQIMPAGTPFWVGFATQSAGGTNVKLLLSGDGNRQPSATATTGNNWTSNSAPGGPTSQLASTMYPTLCLTSAGATGYGNGNMLTAWDSLGQGNAYESNIPFSQNQSLGLIDIPTSFVVREHTVGRTDVWCPASAGTTSGGPPGVFENGFSRWDYSVTCTYEDF
jgi:hypothetical protein